MAPAPAQPPPVEEDGAAVTGTNAGGFAALGVCPQLVEACRSVGWGEPTPIQVEALPQAIQGRDIIGLAQTGSGKTGAFALPVIQALLEKPAPLFALVLSPTRELAIQISEQFEALGAAVGLRCAVIVGGMDMMAQAITLARRPHVVVATPGRLVDHLSNTKGFSLRNLKYLVIPKERKTYLFSATMTTKVAKLQRACLKNPVKVEVSSKYSTVETLRQQYLFIPAKYKDCYLCFILSELAGSTVMVFTRTCEATRRLALLLRNLGFEAIPISGQMSQPKRIGALTKFKAGERSILICTDVASRGLDIPSVDVVINYDIPMNSKDYIHRVGRTARAGRSGRAVSMVTQYDVELFQRIEQLIGMKMEAFAAEQEEALLMLERVSDAQRIATMTLREKEAGKRGKRKGRDDGDLDVDFEGSAGSQRAKSSGRGRPSRGRGGKTRGKS
eukprot:SM000084S23128  [mRNA]  locus=s84:350532:353802:+ [translate_table: standard]